MTLKSRPFSSGLYFIVLFLATLLEWCMFKCQLGLEYTSFAGTALKALGDVALMLLPYWLLNPGWRWISLVFAWGYPVWCVANLAYFRFWGELIPVAAITMGDNMDGNLMEYGLSLLRWSDIIYLLIPLVVGVAYHFLRPQKDVASIRNRLIAAAVSLLVGLIGQFSYFKSTYAWNNAMSPRSISTEFKDHFFGGYTGQKRLYTYNGMAYYGVRYLVDVAQLLNSSIKLSDSQRSEIAAFLKNYNHNLPQGSGRLNLDSLNVVYIIVESLNAEMLGHEINGLQIMPTLDSLARLEGTVLFDNVVSQIKASSSSDGHLLLMTGLLPPDKVAYSISYGGTNKFPSLSDVLPRHHKYLFLADDGVCWNEGNTLENFGLGHPVTERERSGYDIELLGRDGAMFRQAADTVVTLRQPFFMTLMTISMHVPFKEQGWNMPPEIAKAESIDESIKNYANVCHHTDRYIGEFMRSLPENTIVFIASDHSQGVASEDNSMPPAVFMALNSGRTERISRVIGQVNLFPATLDILGISSAYGGMAPSAFNPSVTGTRDAYGNVYGKAPKECLDSLDAAFRISDLIIRGDYFNSDK